jgi:hypothetical protein
VIIAVLRMNRVPIYARRMNVPLRIFLLSMFISDVFSFLPSLFVFLLLFYFYHFCPFVLAYVP